MPREQVDPGNYTEQLQPVASPVQSFVQAASNPGAGHDLMELGSALQGLSGSLDGLLAKRKGEDDQAATAAGQEAFYRGNKDGYVAATQQGLLPVFANPHADRALQELRGEAKGNDIQAQWQAAYTAWPGKDDTSPQALDNFQKWNQDFIRSHFPDGNVDPYFMKGLEPRLHQLMSATMVKRSQDLNDAKINQAKDTLGTLVVQNGDLAHNVGQGEGGAVNYDSLFSLAQANRQKAIGTGLLNADTANQVQAKAFADLAIKYTDPGYLKWFGEKIPGDPNGATYGQTPDGAKLLEQTTRTIESTQRAQATHAIELHNQQMKQEREDLTGQIQETLSKDNGAAIPQDVIDRATKAGMGDVLTNINNWRKSFQDTVSTSDPDQLHNVYLDMLDHPNAATSIVGKAFSSGAIKGKEFNEAYKFAEDLKAKGDTVTALLRDPVVEQNLNILNKRTQGSDSTMPFDATLGSDGYLAGARDYRWELAQWALSHPDASPADRINAISDIFDRVQKRILPTNSELGKKGDYVPPADSTGPAADSARAAQQTKTDAAGQAEVDKQKADLEAQRPGFFSRTFSPSASAAANKEIDTKIKGLTGATTSTGVPVTTDAQGTALNPDGSKAPVPTQKDLMTWRQGYTEENWKKVQDTLNGIVAAKHPKDGAALELARRDALIQLYHATKKADGPRSSLEGGTVQPASYETGNPQQQEQDAPIRDISAASTYKGSPLAETKGFIFHHTGGGGTPDGVVSTLNGRHLGVQYVMDRDGTIYRTLPDGTRGAHILPSDAKGLSNDNTQGMEIIAKDNNDVTPPQVAAAQRFAQAFSAAHPGVQYFGHGEVNPGHKQADEGMAAVNAIRGAGSATTSVDPTSLMSHAQSALGLKPENAAALIGHAVSESGLNPGAFASKGEKSHGLFQLNQDAGRWQPYLDWATANNRKPEDPLAQLDYAKVEASGMKGPDPHKNLWQSFTDAPNLAEASRIWMDYYEKPKVRNYEERVAAGQAVLGHVAGSSPPPVAGGAPTLPPLEAKRGENPKIAEGLFQVAPASTGGGEAEAPSSAPALSVSREGAITVGGQSAQVATPQAIEAAIAAGARRLAVEGDRPNGAQREAIRQLAATLKQRFPGLNFIGLGEDPKGDVTNA